MSRFRILPYYSELPHLYFLKGSEYHYIYVGLPNLPDYKGSDN
jgi:hypothetical protein